MRIGEWVTFMYGSQLFTGFITSHTPATGSFIVERTLRLESGGWKAGRYGRATIEADRLQPAGSSLEKEDYLDLCNVALDHREKTWFDILTTKLNDVEDAANV